MSIAGNLAEIKERLSGREVKLVAVSKSVGLQEIEEAFKLGVTEFGENRIQDALKKQEELPPYMANDLNWHFIGHLQSNKARKAAGRFALIHSLDSQKLALAISEAAVKQELLQAVLLQVKIVEDREKGGFSPEELQDCFAEICALPGLRVEGLMTMTPLSAGYDMRKKCFAGLKSLRDQLEQKHGRQLKELSMGMSDDYLEAVEYGATMVRIGRGIFQKN